MLSSALIWWLSSRSEDKVEWCEVEFGVEDASMQAGSDTERRCDEYEGTIAGSCIGGRPGRGTRWSP